MDSTPTSKQNGNIQDVNLGSLGNQLQYPFDYQTQRALEEFLISRITAFPVGSIFLSTVSTDPSTLLGYGTWTVYAAGKMLVGVDSGDSDFDLGDTGGEKTHTLITSEIPSHSHTVPYWANPGGTASIQGANLFAQAGTVTSNSTGGDGAHNNMPPFITVYIWKRTA